ncbi:Na+-transporting NADH:ubiquinone oxidoreductase subunit A [Pustulibacterium marinum]|uniref:Na(+)-translocating NADH-quinone reductase subunit A n=1 Tax=Pustulibacterium marinum TaxID=1224947 RepID=A0A1I7G6S7_9FLAO|nr:Na(+)-translocating NADH-quinone reductase subunit A [Pustulibacterium marinum]SFU44133.1 Na+-transporting NADH:ubiquinone oxidoreductase subunit A [Pustulibacterium marinum]
MSNDIRIKKGLDIKLKGEAEHVLSEAPRSKVFSIKPADFHTVTPKLVKRDGDDVKAGETIFFSKYSPSIKFVAPVSGKIKEIRRGAKRVILDVLIEADATDTYVEHGAKSPASMSGDEVRQFLLDSGCWPFIKQRPYDIIANPSDAPKAIFISAVNTAPLAADIDFVLKEKKQAFQTGVNALAKLTEGKVHVSVAKASSLLKDIQGVQLHNVSGPHPAGNVGVQIHHVDPINAGEKVWVVNPEDVAIIGTLFETGKFDATRVVSLAGSSIEKPQYYSAKIGAAVADIIGTNPAESRIISGDVLTGDKVAADGYLGFYDNELTVIPEGNNYRMFGWMPFKDNYIHSTARTSFAWLFPNKKYEATTNLNGEERALVVTGEMEKVMPMDVYPMQLIKACLAGDLEKMENLGIYEVAPEDFALVDYVCTSKIEAQEIIREGLDIMIKEVG